MAGQAGPSRTAPRAVTVTAPIGRSRQRKLLQVDVTVRATGMGVAAEVGATDAGSTRDPEPTTRSEKGWILAVSQETKTGPTSC